MKKILFLCFLFVGCANYNQMIEDNIPMAGFDSFTYHRAGNATSAHIAATGAKIENGIISIESISIAEDFGPFLNLSVELKGYRRQLPKGSDIPDTPKLEDDPLRVRIVP